ncbi:MAG: prepilin-type N-terminal cleavage/methylation domain-containing protein [Myxococcales bacterium]|nr:MAG: prepilin-type N-terminal cleavage/methylation domain-containing protein [Myxococcales bacterium]
MYDKKHTKHQAGFTLVELMTTVLILGILATSASANFSRFKTKARRSELTLSFGAVKRQQEAYHAAYNRYAADFDELGFAIRGGSRLSAASITGGRYAYTMDQPWGEDSYYCVATGNIDDDEFPDVAVLEVGRQ